ncbi:MAG TPA: hypothetical protein DCP92_12650 [Nitrospiraceae bacterium]|nr:hypothetical protein [Nitrospiraceae bacterium]
MRRYGRIGIRSTARYGSEIVKKTPVNHAFKRPKRKPLKKRLLSQGWVQFLKSVKRNGTLWADNNHGSAYQRSFANSLG